MSDLISRKKIHDYIKGEINPYGKPFEGTAYELGLKIMRYIDSMDSAYSVDKVVEELEGAMWLTTNDDGETNNLSIQVVSFEDAIELVKQGGIRKDVE